MYSPTRPPLDRDMQIEMMKNSEARMDDTVTRLLSVPAIGEAAKRCAFDERKNEFTSRSVKVARFG